MQIPNIPLTNRQISDTLSKHAHTSLAFTGVKSIDQLPLYLKPNSFIIINTTESSHPTGHWVLYGVHDYFRRGTFFCSFGRSPDFYDNRLLALLNNTPTPGYIFNDIPYQSPHDISCGHFTCYVADHLCMGLNYAESLKGLSVDDLQKNDSIVRQYYYTHMLE